MVVHSYARFSDPKQEGGDSLRRQREAAQSFCDRHGYQLSDMQFSDKGKSGFKGDKQKALDAFMRAIEDGRVRPGEMLLVEAIDRLSRREIRHTQNIVNTILDAGVHIAILIPTERIFLADDNNSLVAAVEIAAHALSAHQYSKNLSDRIKSQQAEVRRRVREGEKLKVTNSVPFWLEWDAGKNKFVVDRDRVKAVKHIFKRTVAGVGIVKLTSEMNELFEPPNKKTDVWTPPTIDYLIGSRNVLGELKCAGEVFKDYYPAVIDLQLWRAANAAKASRFQERGPRSKNPVNMFTGLLFDAERNCSMHRLVGGSSPDRFFKSSAARNGTSGCPGVHETVLENMIFKLLPDLDLAKVKADPRRKLLKDKEWLESEIENIKADFKQRKRRSANALDMLADAENQLMEVEDELKKMPAKRVMPTQGYRKKLLAMPRGTKRERIAVRDQLRAIVKRIDIVPIKMGPSKTHRVRSLIEIEFHTGDRGRAVQNDNEQLVGLRSGGELLRDQIAGGTKFDLKWYRKTLAAMCQ